MAEREAILATLNEYADAYCEKDIDRLMSIFDIGNDISVIGTGSDELCSGPQDIRNLFLRNFAEAKATRFSWGWQHVTIRDDFALVATEVSLLIDQTGSQIEIPLRWTIVLANRSGKWRWLHRNASVAANAQRSGHAYPIA